MDKPAPPAILRRFEQPAELTNSKIRNGDDAVQTARSDPPNRLARRHRWSQVAAVYRYPFHLGRWAMQGQASESASHAPVPSSLCDSFGFFSAQLIKARRICAPEIPVSGGQSA